MLANFIVAVLCAAASSTALSSPSSLFAQADGDKCVVKLKSPPPPPTTVCGRNGTIANAVQVGGVTKASAVESCVARCQKTAECVSFSYDGANGACRLYAKRVIDQRFKRNDASSLRFWKHTCWTCECGSGETNCNGKCYNLQSSTTNCGQCSLSCPANSLCVMGSCTCNPECTGGQECNLGTCQCPATKPEVCDGQCTNVNGGDNANCGACDNPCVEGAECLDVGGNGQCTCKQGTDYCPNGGNPSCADLQTDNNNCGTCSNRCPDNYICQGGRCICNRNGFSLCDQGCVNTNSDRNNCGSCGHVCPQNYRCNSGQCECRDPDFNCVKFCGDTCTDICSENNNCAICGGTCPAGTHCYFAGCVNNN